MALAETASPDYKKSGMKILNRFVLTSEPVGLQKARALLLLALRAYIPCALFWCLARWPLIALGCKWLAYHVDMVFVFPWQAMGWLLSAHVTRDWTVAYILQFAWLSMLFFVWLPMCAAWLLWRVWTACEFIAPRSRR